MIFTGIGNVILLNLLGFEKIFSLPFIILGIGLATFGFFEVKGNTKDNLKNIVGNIGVISFAIFWYSCVILIDYISIRDGDYDTLAFSIILWIGGLILFHKKK